MSELTPEERADGYFCGGRTPTHQDFAAAIRAAEERGRRAGWEQAREACKVKIADEARSHKAYADDSTREPDARDAEQEKANACAECIEIIAALKPEPAGQE